MKFFFIELTYLGNSRLTFFTCTIQMTNNSENKLLINLNLFLGHLKVYLLEWISLSWLDVNFDDMIGHPLFNIGLYEARWKNMFN
jgi:hypothetical protein